MQIQQQLARSGLRPAPLPQSRITGMIRINIKDGQISSRRFHPSTQPQQQQHEQGGQAPWVAAAQRRRVITSSAAAGGAAAGGDAGGAAKSNYMDCTISLTKAIIGAGQCNRKGHPTSREPRQRLVQ
jgi:hypothetical protein